MRVRGHLGATEAVDAPTFSLLVMTVGGAFVGQLFFGRWFFGAVVGALLGYPQAVDTGEAEFWRSVNPFA